MNGGPSGTSSRKADTSLTATTSEGWADQTQQTTLADGEENTWDSTAISMEPTKPQVVETVQSGGSEALPGTSKGDDFTAAGGWGDAPAPKELEKAARVGGTGWQEDIKKPVPVAKPGAEERARMTWAQIAKYENVLLQANG